MKFSLKFAVLGLGLLKLVSHAHADPQPNPLQWLKQARGGGIFYNNFCGDPLKTICDNFSMTTDARLRRLHERAAGFSSTALMLTRTQFNLSEMSLAKIEDVKNLLATKARKQAIVDAYLGHLMYLAGVANSPEGLNRIGDNVKTVKRLLLKSIDAEALAMTIDPITAGKMRYEINRTIIVQTGSPTSIDGVKPAHKAVVQSAFLANCGVDGLAMNAFAMAPMTDDQTKYLVICPGWLMAAAGDERNATVNLENLIQVLGHEWGHHIDNAYFPETYERFGQCILKNYSQHLLPLQRNQLTPEQNAAYPLDLDTNAPLTKVRIHMREMVADLWGARVVRQYYRESIPATAEPMIKSRPLRESYGAFCSVPSEGIHPTGSFRIELLLGFDEGMREIMGCLPDPRRPACSLMGESRIR